MRGQTQVTTPKSNQRAESTGLVLLVVAFAALIIGPAAAETHATAVKAGAHPLQIVVKAPERYALTEKAIHIVVTCRPAAEPAVACRSSILLSYWGKNGRKLSVPAVGHVSICHWGSNQARRCWIPVGEPTVYRRHVARGAAALIVRRALHRGPVWMKVTASAISQSGAQGRETTRIRITN